MLRAHGGPHAVRATIIWEERYAASRLREHVRTSPPELAAALERPTFFSELRRPERAALRDALWPLPAGQADAGSREQFREQELRAQLLATAARLGHAFIDLYVASMANRTTLAVRRGEDGTTDGHADAGGDQLIAEYLDVLEAQRVEGGARAWAAFDELAEIARNFHLIIDVNAPDARPNGNGSLSESARYLASLLRQQQPVGGMAGQVNQTLVKQFRMPGYPFVLVTTDLLQEGEDLHTFCSSVHHYGISWTPSAMEQRIGRIDRVRSQTDRRLSALDRDATGDDLLQVHFPYLEDTVEVLQVERVLERMNTFLRLMHEGLAVPQQDQRRIDVGREMVAARRRVEAIRGVLRSAFPVPDGATKGTKRSLAVPPELGASLRARLGRLAAPTLGGLAVEWAATHPKGTLLGTAELVGKRRQPFMLVLRPEAGYPVVRCVSPIGRVEPEADPAIIVERAARMQPRLGAIPAREARSYDLTVEDDVLLGTDEHDLLRVGLLLRRVVEHADRLEREHFDDGHDEHLDAFEADLRGEVDDDG
jgi:hypothetical protein